MTDKHPLEQKDQLDRQPSHRRYSEKELVLIREVEDKSTKDIELYIPAKDKKLSDEHVHGIATTSGEHGFLSLGRYVSTGISYPDLVYNLYRLVNGSRSILVQNVFKAKLMNKNSEGDELYERVYPLIRNGLVQTTARSKQDITRARRLQSFLPWLWWTHQHQSPRKYVIAKSPVNLGLKTINEKYKVVEIPRDEQKMFMRPGKHFQEIKKLLEYNEKNGFWSFKIDGQLIPILCTHEYMIYDGKPPSDVAALCYKDGLCKFCKQELLAYHEKIEDNIPVKMYDLIYKFIESIDVTVDETMLLHSLYTIIMTGIDKLKNTTTMFNEQYELVMIAYAGVYLFAIYEHTKSTKGGAGALDESQGASDNTGGKILYNVAKINLFLDAASIYWMDLGWNKSKVKQLSQDTNMFPDLSNINDIIRLAMFTAKDDAYADIVPAAVLLGRLVNPRTDIIDGEGGTSLNVLQKIFMQSFKQGEFLLNSPMMKLNNDFYRNLARLWKFIAVKAALDQCSGKAKKTSGDVLKMVTTVPKDYLPFWNKVYKHYCPEGKEHRYVSGKCSQCGLEESGKNKEEVYKKYLGTISGSFLQSPQLISTDKLSMPPLWTQKDIETFDEHVLDTSVPVNIETLSFLQLTPVEQVTLLDKFNDNIEKLVDIIQKYTGVVVDKKLVKRGLAFIVAKEIAGYQDLASEVKSACFPIKSIELVLMTMSVEHGEERDTT